MTYAELTRPAERPAAGIYDLALVATGSALVAVSAWIAVPLPFSPVPVTAQTFAVLLVGALLGARRAAAAMLLYLTEGICGLPVFAGGATGIAWLLGPTGGYLLGFVPAAAITGYLAERAWDRTPWRAAAAMTVGTVALFACGLAWLAFFVGASRVLALGLAPFVPGAILKIAIAAMVLPSGWAVLRRAGVGIDRAGNS